MIFYLCLELSRSRRILKLISEGLLLFLYNLKNVITSWNYNLPNYFQQYTTMNSVIGMATIALTNCLYLAYKFPPHLVIVVFRTPATAKCGHVPNAWMRFCLLSLDIFENLSLREYSQCLVITFREYFFLIVYCFQTYYYPSQWTVSKAELLIFCTIEYK